MYRRPTGGLQRPSGYFNTASRAPQLQAVRAAGEAALERRSQPWTIAAANWFADIERLRPMFAQVIDAESDSVGYRAGTSCGFAVAARNLPLAPSDFEMLAGKRKQGRAAGVPAHYRLGQGHAIGDSASTAEPHTDHSLAPGCASLASENPVALRLILGGR